jgi:hypothetical protein
MQEAGMKRQKANDLEKLKQKQEQKRLKLIEKKKKRAAAKKKRVEAKRKKKEEEAKKKTSTIMADQRSKSEGENNKNKEKDEEYDEEDNMDVREEHLRQIFDVLDIDNDGSINIKELNEGLKHAGLSRRTQSLFELLDTDHLGVVDWDHFQRVGSGFLKAMQDGDGEGGSGSGSSSESEDGAETVEVEVLVVDEEIEKEKEKEKEKKITRKPSQTLRRVTSVPSKTRHNNSNAKNNYSNNNNNSGALGQHHIVSDIRMRQWERLCSLQKENDEMHEKSVLHAKEMEKMVAIINELKDEINVKNNTIKEISVEADTVIQQLQKELDDKSKQNKKQQGGKKKQNRRASFVQRLTDDVAELNKSEDFHLKHISLNNQREEDLLKDIRTLTTTNEELNEELKEKERTQKEMNWSLAKSAEALDDANKRHDQLVTKIDLLSDQWAKEDVEEKNDDDDGERLCEMFLVSLKEVADNATNIIEEMIV